MSGAFDQGPTFIIAGERRCGTTSLYHDLAGHPEVYLVPDTDVNYFVEDEIASARRWRDGEADATTWEGSHTPEAYAALFAPGRHLPARGHKGADLLFWRPAHDRIRRYAPEVRLVVTLRNPVARAWSHYWNEVGKGRETLGFEQALDAEEERCARSAYARDHLSYLRRGEYARNLETLFETVPRERVHVVILEERARDPEGAARALHAFLGVGADCAVGSCARRRNENWTMVPRAWASSGPIRHVESAYTRVVEGVLVRATRDAERRRTARKRAYSLFRRPADSIAMPAAVRERLTRHYAAHNRDLEATLGRRLDIWS